MKLSIMKKEILPQSLVRVVIELFCPSFLNGTYVMKEISQSIIVSHAGAWSVMWGMGFQGEKPFKGPDCLLIS